MNIRMREREREIDDPLYPSSKAKREPKHDPSGLAYQKVRAAYVTGASPGSLFLFPIYFSWIPQEYNNNNMVVVVVMLVSTVAVVHRTAS